MFFLKYICLVLQCIELFFIFVIIWLLGVSVDFDGRGKFDVYMRKVFVENKFLKLFSESFSVYVYLFDSVKMVWIEWMQIIFTYICDL